MTGNSVLLDTNIISALLMGDVNVADNIDAAKEAFIPIIVIGELHYGAQYSANIQKNTNNINKLIERYGILKTDEQTAEVYGVLKASLRRKGKPIPENDIWIAAIAHQHGLTLVTRDKHFSEIDELKIIAW